MQYGAILPEPEFIEIVRINPAYFYADTLVNYRVTTGRRDHPVSFTMCIKLPSNFEYGHRYPAVIDGDMCWSPANQLENMQHFTNHGIMFVTFNRTELVYDCAFKKTREAGLKGPLFDCYKDSGAGVIQGWAWGFSRCVDALLQTDLLDDSMIAFTGFSRGAKCALLAGALDGRATIVNPVETNGLGAACFRTHLTAINDEGIEKRSETLADMAVNFPQWITPALESYAMKEEELPFDSHYLKALVAPRTLLVGEAENDIWGNSIGSYQTNLAAKEVWKFYGNPENILWYYRKGNHAHEEIDYAMLANVMRHRLTGEPLNDDFGKTPFKKEDFPPIHDYACPVRND